MAIRILSSENITGTITGIGTYTAGNSVKIFEAQRSGGAVKSDWSYDDATTDMSLGTNTNHAFNLKTNNTNRISIDNAGNVGMGISPTEKLDIFKDTGSTYIRVYDSSANSEVGLKLQNDAKTWTLQNWGSGGDNLRLLNNAGNIVQLWDDNGNVMIGNANDPEKKLHILTSTTDHTPQVLIQNGSSGDASLTFNVSGQSYVIGIDHDDSSKFKIAASGNLGTNDRVTLLSSGNVGIGTITPGRKLTVTGDASGDANNLLLSNENDTNGDSASIGFSMLSNNTYVKAGIFFQRITTQGRGDLIFANNNEVNGNNVGITNEIMSIRNTGAIEIKGTSTTLNGKAFITNTDALMTIGSTQSSGVPKDMAFFNGGERMRIQATTGNVGIGATSPSGKLEVAGGNTSGFRLSNLGNQSAYDQIRMTYTGYNSGAPTVTFMPLTTPGSGNAYTTFHFSNTNGIDPSSNNNANVDIDGNLTIGNAKGLQETVLQLRNYDTNLAATNTIQASLRMSGRYWSGAASQLVETRINSVHQESNGNGGSALTFMTQTGGDGVVEQMRIDKVGNVGIGTDDPAYALDVDGMVAIRNSTGPQLLFFETGSAYTDGMRLLRYQDKLSLTYGWNANEEALTVVGGTGSDVGNVGIGTTSPPAKLTVISSGAQGIQLGSDPSSSGNSSRLFWTNTSGSWAIMALGQVLSVRSAATPGSTSGTSKVQLTNYSSTAWTASSDESLKENINPIGNVLDKINNYRCIEYNFIDDEDKNKKIGFIAQDWQKDFPQIVEEMEDEKIGMKYTETIPVLLKAIQELKAEIELLKNK